MAITRDQLRAAVEQFLPRTANFSRSADLGEKSQQEIFSRLQQIALTALLLDPNAVFYLVYLSAQRTLIQVRSTLELLDELLGNDQLRALSPDLPVPVESLQKLQQSRVDLLRISGSLASNGRFNSAAFVNFQSNITGFLTDEIKPNVLGRNQAVVEDDIRSTMQLLASSWTATLLRLDRLLATASNFQSSSLLERVTSGVVAAINNKLVEVEASLSSQTTAEQARAAEQNMADLAAAQAALQSLGAAPSAFGAVVVGPAFDGSTDATYLDLEGVGTPELSTVVVSGSAGRLYLDPIIASVGSALDDADADQTTPLFEDSSATFVALGLVGNEILTFVATGRSHRVARVVSETQIELDPQIQISISDAQYVITQLAPGTFFRDDTATFWSEFAEGSTPSTVVALGTQGALLPVVRASGTNATNLSASGTEGALNPDFVPQSSTGTTASATNWSDANATFVSSGVDPALHQLVVLSGVNVGTYAITSVDDETTLTLSGASFSFPETGQAYAIRRIDGATIFEDSGASFLTSGVQAGQSLVVLDGSQSGTYTITSVESQTTLVISTGTFTHETGLLWDVPLQGSVLVSVGAAFQSAGVIAGDVVSLTAPFVQSFTVLSVDSQEQLTLVEALPQNFSGATFSISPASDETTIFRQLDGADFVGLGVDTGDEIIIGGVTFEVASLDLDNPTTTLILTEPAAVDAGPLSWVAQPGSDTLVFEDATSSPFQDLDVSNNALYRVGDEIIIDPGSPAEFRTTIAEIVSASRVTLNEPITAGRTGVSYAVANIVRSGQVLTAGSRQTFVEQVTAATRLRVAPPLNTSIGLDVAYQIANAGSPATTRRLLDASLSGGFEAGLIGNEIEITAGTPARGLVIAVADPNQDAVNEAIDFDFEISLAEEEVAYRILNARSGTTAELQTAASLSGVAVSDQLTLWEEDPVFSVTAVGSASLQVDPLLPAGLSSRPFVVLRGGATQHGRYLLLESLVSQVVIDANTLDTLRLRVAESLISFGADVNVTLGFGSSGALLDPEGTQFSTVFEDPTADFLTLGAQVGDRLTLNGSKVAYVSAATATQLTFAPSLRVETVTEYALERTDISGAIEEAQRVRDLLEQIQVSIQAYEVPRNATIEGIISLLEDQQADRAVDLLLDGLVQEFVALDVSASSYVGNARGAASRAGQNTRTSTTLADNVAGVDPSTGSPSPASNSATTYNAVSVDEEVDAIVDLSFGTTALAGDERVQAVADLSLEEIRNREIYRLTGETVSQVITDTDPTLPWIAQTGSVRDRIQAQAEALIGAIQYILEHPDEFDEATIDEAT